MTFKRKHVNLLRSCSLFLRTRGNTPLAKKFSWSGLMVSYADELNEIIELMEEQGVDETPISIDEIFGKGK